MKKLMIVASVALAASFAQAVTASWSTGKMYWDGVGTKLDGGTTVLAKDTADAYMFVLGVSNSGAPTDYTTLLNSLNAKTIWDGFNAKDKKLTVGTTTYDLTGSGSATKTTGKITIDDGSVYSATDPASYVYGVVIVTHKNGDVIDAYSANTFTAQITTTKVQNSNVALAWSDADSTKTTWQSVPEPTSGLLLLLGVAGLALRRRRA